MDIYSVASSITIEIEAELKRLGRWMEAPLDNECFINMGAFGSNTMSFEQWLQFVLIPRLEKIVEERSEFPIESNLATYSIRYFDGDNNSASLQNILYRLDQLINQSQALPINQTEVTGSNTFPPTVSQGDTTIPSVLYSIAEVLPQYELNDLESQLQTFDTFLSFLSPTVRPTISDMLMKAANQAVHLECKRRIELAAQNVAEGKRAATPYNHDEAMKKYKEEHQKNFPPR